MDSDGSEPRILQLPADIVEQICGLLDPVDVVALSTSCNSAHRLLTSKISSINHAARGFHLHLQRVRQRLTSQSNFVQSTYCVKALAMRHECVDDIVELLTKSPTPTKHLSAAIQSSLRTLRSQAPGKTESTKSLERDLLRFANMLLLHTWRRASSRNLSNVDEAQTDSVTSEAQLLANGIRSLSTSENVHVRPVVATVNVLRASLEQLLEDGNDPLVELA